MTTVTDTVQTRDTTNATPRPNSPETTDQVLEIYPALTAHLICQSLGYFTPHAAANAILAHRNGQDFYCEWYMSQRRADKTMREIGARAIKTAFRMRHSHQDYMAHYPLARALVDAAKQGMEPTFSSWQ